MNSGAKRSMNSGTKRSMNSGTKRSMNSGTKRSMKSGTEIEMRQILKQKTNLIFDKVKPMPNAENVPKTARFKQLSI
jgi:hypothetical protein